MIQAGEFGDAYVAIARAHEGAQQLAQLHVVADMQRRLCELQEDTQHRLEAALQLMCTEFDADVYLKVRRVARLGIYPLARLLSRAQCCRVQHYYSSCGIINRCALWRVILLLCNAQMNHVLHV